MAHPCLDYDGYDCAFPQTLGALFKGVSGRHNRSHHSVQTGMTHHCPSLLATVKAMIATSRCGGGYLAFHSK